MASAWGSSWASHWGNSWGSVASTTTTTSVGSVGPGRRRRVLLRIGEKTYSVANDEQGFRALRAELARLEKQSEKAVERQMRRPAVEIRESEPLAPPLDIPEVRAEGASDWLLAEIKRFADEAQAIRVASQIRLAAVLKRQQDDNDDEEVLLLL